MTTRSGAEGDRPDPGLNVIMGERRRLMNVAYRLLGSLGEAEDVVQETYARWYAMSREQDAIESPGAWLKKSPAGSASTCSLQPGSARALCRRMDPRAVARPWGVGKPDSRAASPLTRPTVTLDESINMAFLVMLDSITAGAGRVHPS